MRWGEGISSSSKSVIFRTGGSRELAYRKYGFLNCNTPKSAVLRSSMVVMVVYFMNHMGSCLVVVVVKSLGGGNEL